MESSVVYLQLFQGVLYILIFFALSRIDTAVDHGLHLLVAREHFLRRVAFQSYGIAHSGVGYLLDAAADVSYLSGLKYVCGHRIRSTDSHLCYLVFFLRVHKANDVALLYLPVKNPGVNYYSLIIIIF